MILTEFFAVHNRWSPYVYWSHVEIRSTFWHPNFHATIHVSTHPWSLLPRTLTLCMKQLCLSDRTQSSMRYQQCSPNAVQSCRRWMFVWSTNVWRFRLTNHIKNLKKIFTQKWASTLTSMTRRTSSASPPRNEFVGIKPALFTRILTWPRSALISLLTCSIRCGSVTSTWNQKSNAPPWMNVFKFRGCSCTVIQYGNHFVRIGFHSKLPQFIAQLCRSIQIEIQTSDITTTTC